MALICSGCTTKQQVGKAKKEPPQSIHTERPKKDGTVISMKKIKPPAGTSSIDAYRMMYWSDGLKVEAYVATPKGPGTFSLAVYCHGGWTIPMEVNHLKQMSGEGGLVKFDSSLLNGVYYNRVTIAPLYRGYGNSDGKVEGIYENTRDTENAIKAVMNYFNSKKETRHVQDFLYLEGWSMGGAVCMRVAAEREHVKSVIAISPFVGWNLFNTWEQENDYNVNWFSFYYSSIKAYGQFDPNNETFKRQSIPYEKIKAPTLLIHGTSDHTVPWQATQFLYTKMIANHQDVTLKLIEGGNHGLTNKWDELGDIIYKWYSKHL